MNNKKNMLTNSEPKSLCLNCTNHIPIIDFDLSNKNVLIKCDCGYHKTLSLHDYLSKIKQSSSIIDYQDICSIHNKKYKYFCLVCDRHICEYCINNNCHHDRTFLVHLSITKYKMYYENHANYIYKYIPAIMENKLAEIENILYQLENSFNNFMNQYEELITFYEVLLVNYTNTYNSNYNLHQLTFHFCKTEEKQTEKYFCDSYPFSLFQYDSILDSLKKPELVNCSTYKIDIVVKMNNGKFAICTDENQIIIFNSDFSPDITFSTGLDVQTFCQLDNEIIVIASKKSLNFFTITKKRLKKVYSYETKVNISQIRNLINNRIALISCDDNQIHIFEFDNAFKKNINYNILVDSGIINDIIYIKERDFLISVTEENISICDMRTYQIINTFSKVCEHSDLKLDFVYSFLNNKMIVGDGNEIKIFDIDKGINENSIKIIGNNIIGDFVALNEEIWLFQYKDKYGIINLNTKKYNLVKEKEEFIDKNTIVYLDRTTLFFNDYEITKLKLNL